jgi:hypothetical protein
MIQLDEPIIADDGTVDVNRFQEAAAQLDGEITYQRGSDHSGWDVCLPTRPPAVIRIEERTTCEFVVCALRLAVQKR